MQSAFLYPLPPNHSEHQLTLSNQQIYLQLDAQLEQLPGDLGKQSETAPLIQNYYSLQKEGFLIKVTLIRIGRQVLRLTDKIIIKQEFKTEEDVKTKCSAYTSPLESCSQSFRKHKKNCLSEKVKYLLKMFEQWMGENYPESLKCMTGLHQQFTNQTQVINTFAYDSTLREYFLSFNYSASQQSFYQKVAKTVNHWTKRCLLAKEEERMKEEYIQQILQKM